MSDQDGQGALLADRPDLVRPLESVLAVDEEHETWTFDEVPVDSGQFGELVGEGVVEKIDGAYRLADPEATSRALSEADAETSIDRTDADQSHDQSIGSFDRPLPSFPTVDLTTVTLIGGLALVALARLFPWSVVFRDGRVVLSGNDPYYYRHWAEHVVVESSNVFDVGALALWPEWVRTDEPLLVALLWWFAELLGDGADRVADVMAWYPVVSAVLTAGLLYWIAVEVTGDRRVAVAAVLFLAVLPGHAMRTSLGYGDHHALDYLWLAVTAATLVALAGTTRSYLRDRQTWALTGAFALGVATQVLSWEAGPLLLAPIGLVALVSTLRAVHTDRDPGVELVPVAVGLGVATAITATVHAQLQWHAPVVAFAPTLVLVGVLGVVATAYVVDRTTGSVRHLAAVDAALGVVGVTALYALLPSYWESLLSGFGQLFTDRAVAETFGLFNPESLGFLLLFGFTLVLALPAMVLGIRRSIDDARWAVVTVYAWYFFLLAAIQTRFVGELAAFAAFFAGVGFVSVAAWVDAVRPIDEVDGERLHLPDRQTLGTLAVLFLLFGSLGAIQTPIKTSQLTIEDGTYHSATFVEERVERLDQAHDDDRVLSRWGRNRVYNYFAFGQSDSYQYARNNYEEFVLSSDPDGLYDRLDDRVGYVVVDNSSVVAGPEAAATRLTDSFGSQTDEYPGIAHYRPLYVPPSGDRTVFELVPGATLRGTGPANATVTLSTDVSIEGANFTYERRSTTGADGSYAVRVPNPGEYTVGVGDATERVRVTESDVRTGSNVTT